jgi:hypothetical protein
MMGLPLVRPPSAAAIQARAYLKGEEKKGKGKAAEEIEPFPPNSGDGSGLVYGRTGCRPGKHDDDDIESMSDMSADYKLQNPCAQTVKVTRRKAVRAIKHVKGRTMSCESRLAELEDRLARLENKERKGKGKAAAEKKGPPMAIPKGSVAKSMATPKGSVARSEQNTRLRA